MAISLYTVIIAHPADAHRRKGKSPMADRAVCQIRHDESGQIVFETKNKKWATTLASELTAVHQERASWIADRPTS